MYVVPISLMQCLFSPKHFAGWLLVAVLLDGPPAAALDSPPVEVDSPPVEVDRLPVAAVVGSPPVKEEGGH